MGIRVNSMAKKSRVMHQLHQPVEHHHLLVAGAAFLLIGGALFFGNFSRAAKDTYVFSARGDVIQVDRANNTLKVYVRHASAEAVDDLGGKITEFNITGAKVYGYNTKSQKVRITVGALDVGDEVVLRGAKRSSDRFNVSTITENDNRVTVKGTLKAHDKSNRILTIELGSVTKKADGKALRPDTFSKGTKVLVYYAGSTKFKNKSGNEINPDEVANNSENIEVRNVVVKYGSRIDVLGDAVVVDG